METCLGLDLGSNSIGWALLSEQEACLVDCGSRIFQKAVEDKTATPKNHARRSARLLRRVIQRKARRRQQLQNFLISQDFLPKDLATSNQREALLNSLGDPYQLRAEALSRALTKQELGRALLHLCMRRGFLSTRVLMLFDFMSDPDIKAILQELENQAVEGNTEAAMAKNEAEKALQKEEGQTKKEISELEKLMGSQTLGTYLYSLPANERKRNRRTSRKMYEDELQRIFEYQKKHHSELTEDFLKIVQDIVFFQRPIYWDKSTIGKCSLEPRRLRTHVARLEYQRFRYLQDINNIRWAPANPYIDEQTGEVFQENTPLTEGQRQILTRALEAQKTVSWKSAKELLGLSIKCKINLEESKSVLQGNYTAYDVRKIYAMWDTLNITEQYQLIEDLLSFEKITPLKKRLMEHWQCDITTAVKLIEFSREAASLRANLSLNALKKLLPFMEQGMRFDEAKVAAGYQINEQNNKVLNLLPEPPQLANTIVQKALYEVRNLVNAIIKTYGKPSSIHVELPRDFASSKKQKEKMQNQQKINEATNKRAIEQFESIRIRNPHLKLPLRPRYEDLLKYRLWEEQGRVCIYSGKSISETQLFSAAVEIDHILPYSRTVNDSYMNKVVCFIEENREKKNRTPYEAFQGEKYEAICLRANKLPPKKQAAFLLKSLDDIDDFINSQLSDTAYISREVVAYLKKLYTHNTDVITTKGATTALLRQKWGLNTLLGTDKKNRQDHRHHTIDAIVIALTNRKRYKQIIDAIKTLPIEQQNNLRNLYLPEPWADFRETIAQKINSLIVSHAASHKLTGALHEKTAYGLRTNDQGGYKVVYRKMLDGKFTEKQIQKIVDVELKELLLNHLDQHNGNAKLAFNPENLPKRHKSQAPIRHVRVVAAEQYNSDSHMEIKDKQLNKINTVYPLGNNHHIEIIRSKKTGKHKSLRVSTIEAANRARRLKQPIIQKDHGDEWDFIMALHINDLVEATANNITRIYRVQNISEKLTLRLHTASTQDHVEDQINTSPKSLVENFHMKPLTINILGHRLYD